MPMYARPGGVSHGSATCPAGTMARPPVAPEAAAVSATAAELSAFVAMARAAIRREYPVLLLATLEGPEDLGLPRVRTPAFCGSFDWHSAVHGHWCLARAARLHPGAPWAADAQQALGESLTR